MKLLFVGLGIGLVSMLIGYESMAQTDEITVSGATGKGRLAVPEQEGIAADQLAENAPAEYTIKKGDTLWDISGLYLKQPWRWPQLWAVNRSTIANPHRIYPGQVLVLTKVGDRYLLQSLGSGRGVSNPDDLPLIKVSPNKRLLGSTDTGGVAPVNMAAIKPFLVDITLLDQPLQATVARVVTGPDNRLLLGYGDALYARTGVGLNLDNPQGETLRHIGQRFRIFRPATVIKDPESGEILGYESRALGYAALEMGQQGLRKPNSEAFEAIQPARLRIQQSKEEIRMNDWLQPAEEETTPSFYPHAPNRPVMARIATISGNGVQYAGINHVVVLNQGRAQGMEPGHVLALMKNAQTTTDRTDEQRTPLLLKGERNGLIMVFRSFERVSYALVLQLTDALGIHLELHWGWHWGILMNKNPLKNYLMVG